MKITRFLFVFCMSGLNIATDASEPEFKIKNPIQFYMNTFKKFLLRDSIINREYGFFESIGWFKKGEKMDREIMNFGENDNTFSNKFRPHKSYAFIPYDKNKNLMFMGWTNKDDMTKTYTYGLEDDKAWTFETPSYKDQNKLSRYYYHCIYSKPRTFTPQCKPFSWDDSSIIQEKTNNNINTNNIIASRILSATLGHCKCFTKNDNTPVLSCTDVNEIDFLKDKKILSEQLGNVLYGHCDLKKLNNCVERWSEKTEANVTISNEFKQDLSTILEGMESDKIFEYLKSQDKEHKQKLWYLLRSMLKNIISTHWYYYDQSVQRLKREIPQNKKRLKYSIAATVAGGIGLTGGYMWGYPKLGALGGGTSLTGLAISLFLLRRQKAQSIQLHEAKEISKQSLQVVNVLTEYKQLNDLNLKKCKEEDN